MKSILLLSVMIALAGAIELHPDETHTHEELGQDVANVKARLDCVLDRAPCDKINGEYKEQFGMTIKTACEGCTPEAKKFVKAGLVTLKANFPEDYNAVVKKYDPEGTYMDKLMAVLDAA